MSELDPIRSLRKGWWAILAVTITAVLAAAWVTSRQERIYRASATVVVVVNEQVSTTSDLVRSLDTLERRTIVATFSRIGSSPETRKNAASRLGLETADLRGLRLRGSVIPNTNLIRIEVTGPDRDRAIAVADAVAAEIRSQARRLYRIFSVRPFASATASSRPIYPNPQRNLAVAAILGLFIGSLAALAMEWLRGSSGS